MVHLNTSMAGIPVQVCRTDKWDMYTLGKMFHSCPHLGTPPIFAMSSMTDL